MILRNLNRRSAVRIGLGILLFAIGFYRVATGHGFPGHPILTFFNQYGLMILGILLMLGVFMRLNKTFWFLFGALFFELAIEEGLLSPDNGRRLASLVVIFFLGYFFYRYIRLTFFDARKDAAERKRGKATISPLAPHQLLPATSSYRSHLENKEFLLRDMQKSHANSLVGDEGCWGTRWHFGPLWFENFFGDVEPPFSDDGPLRVIIWQSLREVPAMPGWRHTKLLKYNHLTGFATLPTSSAEPYWSKWDDHAKRHLNKWRKQTEWEIFHPDPSDLFRAYRQSSQNMLLKFYFINLTKQLLLTHADHLVFWAVRPKGGGPIVAGFVSHDIPEAKQSRHLMSFILDGAKSAPVGIGLMDAWHQDAIQKGFAHLDFGVFWMPGDPESWKGFSRFKGQFGITYIPYPPARLRRAGSLKNIFSATMKGK